MAKLLSLFLCGQVRDMASHPSLYTTILPLIALLLLSSSRQTVSLDFEETDTEIYVLDDAPSSSLRTRSRFLASLIIKKGTHCNPISNNICNGVSANNGTAILNCCKTHCRNILGDMNNCGKCGHKCGFGQRCCGGVCTGVVYDVNNCGKCNRKCLPGVKCDYGICGYA